MRFTVCINAPQKVLLQSHSIKTIVNLVIGGKEILSIRWKPVHRDQDIPWRNYWRSLDKIPQSLSRKGNNRYAYNIYLFKYAEYKYIQIAHLWVILTSIKLRSFRCRHDWKEEKRHINKYINLYQTNAKTNLSQTHLHYVMTDGWDLKANKT